MNECLYCHQRNEMKVTWDNVVMLKRRSLLCHICSSKLEKIAGNRCTICSRKSNRQRCIDCMKWHQYYDENDPLTQNISLYKYNDFMKEFIAMWKYRGDYVLGKAFQEEVYRSVNGHFQTVIKDMTVIPIPLSSDRLYERGFNQAEMIANFIPASKRGQMSRIRNEKQSKKTRTERMKTVNPFKLAKSFNNPVLLVDDIYTTGRTIRHAAQLLKEHGCPEIHALTICRG